MSKGKAQLYIVIAGEEIPEDRYGVTGVFWKQEWKDAPFTLALIGRYILTPDTFDYIWGIALTTGDEIKITYAINDKCKKYMVLA